MQEQKNTNTYLFEETESKHFYAGIFNNFRHNWEMAWSSIAQEFQLPINTQYPEDLRGIKDKSINFSLTDWERFINKLSYFFPFVSYLPKKKEDHEEFWKIINAINKISNEYRNYSSHYHRVLKVECEEFQKALELITPILDDLFIKAILHTCHQRKQSKEQIEFFRDKYKEDFNEILIEANERLEKKNKDPIRKEDEYNFVFNHLKRRYIEEKEDKTLILRKAKFEDGFLKADAFLLFVSFGLSKREFQYLLSHTKYYKANHKLPYAFTQWALGQYCFRQPKSMLNSAFSKDALLLQIAEEFSKCPKEIYEHLSSEDQYEFFEATNRYEVEQSNKNVKSISEFEIEHDITRVRYRDRFAYYAIRYLDEFVFKDKIRFQVNVGVYRHDKTNKENDYFSTDRVIDEKLFVFEKLSEVQRIKDQYFENKDIEDSLGWRPYPNAHYQFHKNNIAVWVSGLEEETDSKPKKRKRPPKSELLEELKLEQFKRKACFYLSLNELPQLLYYVLVKKKSEKIIHDILKNKIQHKKDNILTEEQLNSKKMRGFQKGDQVFLKDKLVNRIKIELNENHSIIDKIRKDYSDNKIIQAEEKGLTNVEKGKVAVLLTKDIRRFTRKDARKDWKGWQIAELQRYFAFYDRYRNELAGYCKEVLEIHNELSTLFPIFNFQAKDLFEFLKNYEKQKNKYLTKLLKYDIDNITIDHPIFDAFPKRIYYADKKDYLKNVKSHPVFLDRGIFDDKHPTAGNGKDFVSKNKFFTFTQEALKSKQKFYDFTRIYPFPDERNKVELTQETNSISDVCGKPKQGTPQYLAKGAIYKNEKRIREIQRQDAILLEIIKKEHNSEHLKLAETFYTKEEKEVNARGKGKSILAKKITVSLVDGKLKIKCALKDLRKYKRLERDSRVKTLATYQDKSITREELDQELADYEKVRFEEMFYQIFKLEKKIFSCHLDGAKKKMETEPNFKKEVYEYINSKNIKSYNSEETNSLKSNTLIRDEILIKILIEIRNRFAHNQLPNKAYFEQSNKLYKKDEKETFSTYYLKVTEKICNWLINLK
ncbi:MAG: type VI-B CRISPR-associated RNA-guided ribonuclease Cas13b [Flavobacteriales bacterium]|jgi:hypothetical protein|nr:type VI-B CRISPR-associated RNA-guided ribonuclease Cas13b [Flavobacteriales bacterium]